MCSLELNFEAGASRRRGPFPPMFHIPTIPYIFLIPYVALKVGKFG